MANDLADFQAEAIARGYTRNLALDAKSAPDVFASDLHIVDYVTFDSGTDPGDDVTMYLIESRSGPRGYLVLSDSFHADPRKAAYIDALINMPLRKRQSIPGKEKLSE
jgi:hypothetical protein